MSVTYPDSTHVFQRISQDPARDPACRIKFEAWEQGAIVIATAVLAYGGATGGTLVALAGVLALLIVVVVMSRMPERRARKEEKERFPDVEFAGGGTRAGLALGVGWLLVMGVAFGFLFFFPADYVMTGGAIAAGISALIMWGALTIANQ
ncbi:hypothetical protein [Corynebacterium aquatimens]|uniref:Na+-transporting methylmalonyl-CoA/oxaloacetate decarboxylase gamma subunit n=1 Tax=Corynebacterium aquatimens TaxID=1190508 RepID=A0A931E0K6_9CORY|nr:hypothetical protein [Corynebacterium aquatimens]MBG6121166.1 Na+-transporting methylmalonyl-CoA/oxaloacetate decarboxylase gamma subunit [Corynebacterium aquatimens]WJY66279.1 hypothetical protein CAQUA_07925 [Corynebacterium aquatimens]